MGVLVYVDTNVYLDYLENRRNRFGIAVGDRAFRFFWRAASCEFDILITTKVLNELYGHTDVEKTKMLFQLLKKKLRPFEVLPEDNAAAEARDKENTADALHAILAKKYGARFMITRNKRHLDAYSDLVKSVYPEQV